MSEKVLSKVSPLNSGSYKNDCHYFFECSRLFAAQITDIFDGFWPTLTALKNLRWQVRGYYSEYPIRENKILSQKFVEDDDKTNRPNLYRAFIEEDWAVMEARTTNSLLTNLFACYEGWCSGIVKIIVSIPNEKGLQFPNPTNFSLKADDSENAIACCYYNNYKTRNKHHDTTKLNNWLTSFRFFKEYRNCVIHHGGVASANLLTAYNNFSVLSKNDLGISESLNIPQPKVGDKITLPLRTVVGFSQILIKIVSTYDIEFIRFPEAEVYFTNKIKESKPNPVRKDYTRIEKQCKNISIQSHFGTPDNLNSLFGFFVLKGIMK